MTKRICFLIGDIGLSGGTERVSSLIANLLAEDGHQLYMLSISGGKQAFFPLHEQVELHQLFDQKVSMKKNFFACCFKIRKFVQQHKIDHLIVVDSISCVFTVPALIGLHHVQHICWEHFNFNVDLGVSFRRLGRKWAAKYCDTIVTLTERDKLLWEKGLKHIKAKIIPIANPSPYENIQHLPSLEHKVILSLGRLTTIKGFDRLITAWAWVCKQNDDWTLRIVGSGEDEEQLKQQAKDLAINDRIEFIAATKNVDQYYRTCSFYCLSSRSEGLPMVLIEAQAYGLPIVSMDCDTGPAEIIQNGENGFLCHSVEDLAEGLFRATKMDQQQYQHMVQSSQNNVLRFDSNNIMGFWRKVLE